MSDFDAAAARARADAATDGPWHWFGNTDTYQIGLGYWRSGWGRCTVMDFVRWGMQGAAPRFHRPDDYTMDRADRIVTYEVAPNATTRKDPKVYRADIVGIGHPDAEFIAHARTDLPAALDALARVRELVDKWRTDRLGYPLDDSLASAAFIAVKMCGDELLAALDGTP